MEEMRFWEIQYPNILKWNGYKITREYYFNNAGRQMRVLEESVKARYFQTIKKDYTFPEDGYQGEYISDIAKNIIDKYGRDLSHKSSKFILEAEKIIFAQIKDTLNRLKINFDIFTNEKAFYENGDIKKLLSELKRKGLLYEKDNATWFKASSVGLKQDRVYIKKVVNPPIESLIQLTIKIKLTVVLTLLLIFLELIMQMLIQMLYAPLMR